MIIKYFKRIYLSISGALRHYLYTSGKDDHCVSELLPMGCKVNNNYATTEDEPN